MCVDVSDRWRKELDTNCRDVEIDSDPRDGRYHLRYACFTYKGRYTGARHDGHVCSWFICDHSFQGV